MSPDWQPIDTVPNDTDRILGLCPDNFKGEGSYITECEWCVGANLVGGWWEFSDRNRVYPTHWMPAPPKLTTL